MKRLAVIFLSLIFFAGCAEKIETERSTPPAKQDTVQHKTATAAIDTVSLNREMEKLTLLQQELQNLQQELNDKERQLNGLENAIEAREAQLDQREAELNDRETSLSRLRVFSFIILFLGIVLSAIALVIMTRQQEKQKKSTPDKSGAKPKDQATTEKTIEKETPIADPATSAAGEEKTEPSQGKIQSPKESPSSRAKPDKEKPKTTRRRSTTPTKKTTPRKKESPSDSDKNSQDDKKG